MIIALPIDDKKLDAPICISFGRTPFFLIYDTETDAHTFLENAAATSQGGAGIKAAQAIVDEKISALITPRCGENAAEVLKGAGVKIYKVSGNSIAENIEAIKNDKLDILIEIHAGHHHHQ